MSLTPLYTDPCVVLVPHGINHRIELPVSSKSRLNRLIERFLPSVLIFVFLTYLTFQIIVGCFNCGIVEKSDLGGIRAAFIMNIPFVLGVCTFIGHNLMKKKTLRLFHVIIMIISHASWFFLYSIFIGVYFEAVELNQIRKALRNTTVKSFLPCSINHYQNVYGLEISRYCYLFLYFLTLLCSLYLGICRRCIYFIVKKWRDFTSILFKRHQGEIFIERY